MITYTNGIKSFFEIEINGRDGDVLCLVERHDICNSFDTFADVFLKGKLASMVNILGAVLMAISPIYFYISIYPFFINLLQKKKEKKGEI